MKRNVPVLGFIIGLLLPLLGIVITYYILFHGTPFQGFLDAMKDRHDIAAKVLTLSLIINLLPFMFYTSRRLDLTARGILVATVLYGVLIILLRYVW